MSLILASLAAFMPQGPGSSLAPVVINEFSYDDAGTDDKEFIELFNRTAAPIDISGWVVAGEEGTATSGVNLSFTLPVGTIIPAGGYVVLGTATVPNVTAGCTIAVNFLENTVGPDGITLRDNVGNVIDGVVWCYALWTAPVPTWLEGTGLWGRAFANDVATVPNFTSVQRRVDGYDSNDNGADFVYMMWTPGAANGSQNPLPAPASAPYVNTFDAVSGTLINADFAASFRAPTVYDPTIVLASGVTTFAVPPSPQGGNVVAIADPTGGGDAALLRVPVGDDFLVETWVYVQGGNPLLGPTEGESWAIGVGTTDSYASPVDVPGTYYAQASACPGSTGTAPVLTATGSQQPGATGIAWFAFTSTTQTVLYLVDLNNGGPGFTVLGGPIVATPGVNDGWQRVRLRVQGSNVLGAFGGTFGANDGTVITATVPQRISGQVYLQYRECAIANTNMRPLLLDRLEVYGTVTAGVSFAGTASPTTYGLPLIAAAGGAPVLGNAGFQVTGSNMVPFSAAFFLYGIGNLGAGLPVPGTPATLNVYVQPVFSSLLTIADGSGNVLNNLGLPPINAFAGLPIMTQILPLDPALPDPLPLGATAGMQILVGNG